MRKFVMDAIALSPLPHRCRLLAAQSRYNNNYIAFLLEERSCGRDNPLGIAVTDILRLPSEC